MGFYPMVRVKAHCFWHNSGLYRFLYQVAINGDIIPLDCKESPGSKAAVAPA